MTFFIDDFFKFWPDWVKAGECCGSISVNHENTISLGHTHTGPYSSSFPSIFGILNNKEIEIKLFSLFESYLSSFVFGSIIRDDDFILFVWVFEVFDSILQHDGKSFLLIVAGNNKWEI